MVDPLTLETGHVDKQAGTPVLARFANVFALVPNLRPLSPQLLEEKLGVG